MTVAAALACSVSAARAQGPGPLAETEAIFDWGYSAIFGTGTYRMPDGDTIDLYRGQFSAPLRKTPEVGGGPGVRLVLPVVVGSRNPPDDLLTGNVTDRIDVVSFVPGIELEFPVGERWTLRARAQGGRIAELGEGTGRERVAAFGVRSRFEFEDLPGKPALINGLLWGGVDARGGERGALVRLTHAVEFDVPAKDWRVRGARMHWMPHVLGDWYYRPPDALSIGDGPAESEKLDLEWQVGVAARREQGFKIWFVRFDAVGVAYRFSDRSEGIRFYLNSVF